MVVLSIRKEGHRLRERGVLCYDILCDAILFYTFTLYIFLISTIKTINILTVIFADYHKSHPLPSNILLFQYLHALCAGVLCAVCCVLCVGRSQEG
jgi:succinate dehydrogenase hydrophobic anchor subunit